MTDLHVQLTGLRQRAAEADQLRARAEATHDMAVKRLAEVDGQIRAMGIDPEQAEEELRKLEQQLTEQMAALDAALVDEVAAYQQILRAGQ